MIYKIVKDKCSSCGLCADVCPVGAISQFGPYVIDQLLCIKCGDCLAACPSLAIELMEERL
jgi:ferredoxin